MDFSTNLAKGRQLLEYIYADNSTAAKLLHLPYPTAESTFLDFTALVKWGYSPDWYNYTPTADLNHLQETLGVDPSHNKGIGHSHIETVMQNGIYIPANFAKFNSIVNAPGGMIVAVDNESPTAIARLYHKKIPNADIVPELKYWSDVAYLQWAEVTKGEAELRYVVRHGITNARTISVIRHLLERDGEPETRFGRMVWPDIIWRDEEAIAALLGTPNGSGVARLLIHHKRLLGHKTVEEVMLFGFSEVPGRHEPSLVFKIGDVVVSEGDGTEVGVSGEQDENQDEEQDGSGQGGEEVNDDNDENWGFWIFDSE